MLKKLMFLILPVVLVLSLSCNAKGGKNLKTQKQKVSYSIGLDIGKNFKQNAIDIDVNKLFLGIKDALAGAKPKLTDEEIRAVMMQFQQDRQSSQSKVGAANLEKGKIFLEANKKKKGIVVLPDGLQYKIITQGKGSKPSATDKVTVHYKGTLIDGTEFDSSYKRGQPASFPVNGVIKGWTEILQLMPVGSKWEVFIPGDLAYGERGAGGSIGPNETLIFTIELLSIDK